MIGDINQLATISLMVPQFTTSKPRATTHAPRIHPTIECVVETGAFKYVAILSHKAAERSAASIQYI